MQREGGRVLRHAGGTGAGAPHGRILGAGAGQSHLSAQGDNGAPDLHLQSDAQVNVMNY